MDTFPYTDSEKKTICNLLLDWFDTHRRPLPWREGYDPYQVWISEIMGQQTQMERVVEYFNRWIALFPDAAAVAAADEQQVLKAWEGLGYYTRARNIHRCARILVREHGGAVPADRDLLLDLPGIGPYTASAIVSIAYNAPCPLVDANVERLFARLLDLDVPVKKAPVPSLLHRFAGELLPAGNARDFNQALMEFGALVCTPGAPACRRCPLAGFCKALAAGTVTLRPVPAARKKTIDIVMACGIITHRGRVYIQQREADDVWGGLWEFPGGRLKSSETPEQAARREVREETELVITRLRPRATVFHQYTRYRVTLHGFCCRLADDRARPVLHAAQQYRWVPLSRLTDFPFPAGHRRLAAGLVRAIHRKK
jgi:A/G-specific adenine glycosylase